MWWFSHVILLSACSETVSALDVDGDGYTLADGDCWENEYGPIEGMSSADVHPGAAETWYDGFDQNCDGLSDFDKDGDGHGAISSPDPDGRLPSDDCWDDPDVLPAPFTANNPADQLDSSAVFPGADETWYDDIDQDCAGDDDFDQDGDGFASAAHPDGDSPGDDCFDGADDAFVNDAGLEPAEVNPDADETWYDGTDADCAGNDDFDQDGDGFPRDLECDDLDASRFPDATVLETWYDGVDDNCDGNDGDQDGDGYYVEDYPFEVPAAYEAGDCWDDPAGGARWVPLNGFPTFGPEAAYPGAADAWYDGLDQDCASDADFDQDLDGYDTDVYAAASGYTGDDCDDLVATTHPAATETWYDAVDADCAGDDDFDQDGDGYATDTDCDDVDAAVNPGALEACGDTVDDDCSGSDNDEGAFGCTDFHADADADGHGADTTSCLCEAEGAYTAVDGGDCDDADAAVNPDGTESCATAVDDDCDGSTNSVDAAGCVDWHVDADGDNYGATASQCQCAADGLYTATNDDDCDDGLSSVNPGRTEDCNDVDDDCDGTADEGLTLYYTDADGDTYGAGAGDCGLSGGVANADDCDDTSGMVYPGATEFCDGGANDCDTAASWTEADEDQMVSFVSTSGVWSDVSASFNLATAGANYPDSGTYYFCAGTYYVKFIAIGDETDVIGVYGADRTTFDNNTTTGGTVAVTNGSVTLSGLTITGGHGASGYGGGVISNVYLANPTPTEPNLVLEDCIVTGNTGTSGGGVATINQGWIKLVGTTVEANTATNGGGIFANVGSDITLEDSIVQGNTAAAVGGGVYIDDGTLLATDSYIIDNSTISDAGGIYLDDGTLTLTNSYIVGNIASDDGGGLVIESGTAICTSGGIYGNTAADEGGGVYLATHSSATASFTAVSCDFDTGANSPTDVTVKIGGGSSAADYATYSSYGATASFICSNLYDACI